MDKEKFTAPSFLGQDTSNEQAKKIPFLTLGYPKLLAQTPKKVYIATISKRETDNSGSQSVSIR